MISDDYAAAYAEEAHLFESNNSKLNNLLKTVDNVNLQSLTRDQWNSIEKPVDAVTQAVLDKLVNASRQNDSTNQLKTCGTESYLTLIRPALVKQGYVSQTVPSPSLKTTESTLTTPHNPKKKTPPVKKDDQIRQLNLNKTVQKELTELLNSFSPDKLTYEYGLRKNTIEFRLVTLLYMIWFYLKQDTGGATSSSTAGAKQQDIYKLIQTTRVLTDKLTTLKFKSTLNSINLVTVSEILTSDLAQQCKLLSDRIKFDILVIFRDYPWLTDVSNYYQVIPEFNINLYPCQQRLLELTKSPDSYLILYKSNFGSGKTTSTIGVVANQIETPNVVIYCCASDAVRQTVAQLAYNAGIKFGIATITRGEVKITPNINAKTIPNCKLIVSDYATTFLLLKYLGKTLPSTDSSNLILIIDEPTDGADEQNNQKTQYFSRIFYYAPRRTLLVSATLPESTEMQPYLDHFCQKHDKSGAKPVKIETVISKEVKVGCELVLPNGSTYSPHHHCQTQQDVLKVIEKLQKNHFLNRLYTASILFSLYQKIQENRVSNLFDLSDKFAHQLNHQKINQTVIELLEILSQQSPEVITRVCCSQTKEESSNVNSARTYTNEHLGTTDAHKFLGPTLLISHNPIEFSNICFCNLLQGLDINQTVIDYQKRQRAEEAAIAKCQRELETMASKKSSSSTANASRAQKRELDKEMNDRSRARTQKETEVNSLLDGGRVDVDFPSSCQINTQDHLKRYAQSSPNHISRQLSSPSLSSRYPMELTLIPFETKVSHQILGQRFAGVGIYLPQSESLDQLYSNDVIEHTLAGNLAYTVSDTSISYGVNSPAQNLIITPEIIQGKSIGTIFQLLARVGRPGLSWTAFAFIDYSLATILDNYVFDKGIVHNPEAANMNQALENFYTEIQVKQQQIKQKIAQANQNRLTEAKRIWLQARQKARNTLLDQESELRHQLEQTNIRCFEHFRKEFDTCKPKPPEKYVPPGSTKTTTNTWCTASRAPPPRNYQPPKANPFM